MIIGYVSGAKYRNIELSLRQTYPAGKAFDFTIGDRRCFFFHSVPNKFNKLAYCDDKRLVLCSGLPVRQSGSTDYEVIDTLNQQDIDRGMDYLLDTIVSNVSMIYFRAYGNDGEIILSSDRASAGKMYYRPLIDGIAFSNDFVQLFRFGRFNLNEMGVYALIRYGACPAPLTISRDIHAVPPAHYAVFDLYGNHVNTYTYFLFDFPETNGFDLKPVSTLLDSSTHLLHDLGASILISGGVDSTILVQRLSQHSNRKVKGYYLSFGDKDPELPYAIEVADRTGCELEIFNMESDVVPNTIIEAARSYTHPFNDYSIIPTYYLMKCVGSCEDEALMIDGTGGDEGFGVFDPSMIWRLKVAFGLPKFIKAAAFNLYAHSDLLGTINKSATIPRRVADCNTKDINLVLLTSCPWITLFRSDTKQYEEEINDIIVGGYSRILASSLYNRSFNARQTVAKICHVSCGMWCAKTHSIQTLPNLQAIYPFTWRDMLEEQGKLSWSAKNNKGVRKWPLKKLLEEKFPLGSIYRKKSGFNPPFEAWFSDVKVYELLHDTLLSQNTIIESVVDKVKLDSLVEKLPNSTKWPKTLHNFLWGTMFTELWVKGNMQRFNND